MPTVRSAVDIPDVSLPHVWAVVRDFEQYPLYMADVLDIRYLERSETEALSSWRVLLNGSELMWDEKDVFTPMSRIEFEQTEGDLEVFRGVWILRQIDEGVRVSLEIEFDLGIPSLDAVLNPIGIQAILSNSRSMLEAISGRRLASVSR